MDDANLRKLLLTELDYAYLEEDWVCPLREALEGVDAKRALLRRRDDAKCIWEIVLHVAVWNENIVERVRTAQPASPEEGHWPPLPADLDESAWQLAKSRLHTSLQSVREMIESEPMEKIQSSPWGVEDLACRFLHLAYHIGQITILAEP